MAKVSIITPAYNAAGYVEETIRSVQAQTFTDWEMLVVDDGSRDATPEILARAAAEDDRIRPVASPGNQGPSGARQLGLDAVRGRYVAFLDSDDLWLPEKLERQLAFMDETGSPLTYTAFRRINEDGSLTGRLMPVPSALGYRDLLKNTAIATSTVLIDAESAVPLRMTDAGYDDFCLWLDILRGGTTARGLPLDLMRYRVRGGSVSSRPLRSISWVWNIYRNKEGIPPVRAAWYLANYGARAWLKRRRF